MEPEEIDKLFKNKLGGLPAVPSPDAWMRLQQKMEPPKKEQTRWIYYVAASIALLLISGILYFNNLNQSNIKGVAVVSKSPDSKELKEQGPGGSEEQAKFNLPATQQADPEKQTTEQLIELEQIAQATIPEPDNRINSKKQQTKLVQAKANKLQVMADAKSRKPVPHQIAGQNITALNKEVPETASEPVTVANVNAKNNYPENVLTASVVEVIVKRDAPDLTIGTEDESGLRENLAKKASLLKNIYKQARNLKNGEPVELTALGVNTEKINSETKEIKQKITKVISL